MEDLRAADTELFVPFYADNDVFGGLADWSVRLLTLLLERFPALGYLLDPNKSLLI